MDLEHKQDGGEDKSRSDGNTELSWSLRVEAAVAGCGDKGRVPQLFAATPCFEPVFIPDPPSTDPEPGS